MRGSHDVEQSVVTSSIEDDFTIACGLDRNRFVHSSFQSKRHGTIKRGHHRIDVVKSLGLVQSGVHENGIAGLSPAFPDDTPVAQAGAIVSLQ